MITAFNLFLELMAIVVPMVLLIGSLLWLFAWVDKKLNE
jgi:hypothetical protein